MNFISTFADEFSFYIWYIFESQLVRVPILGLIGCMG